MQVVEFKVKEFTEFIRDSLKNYKSLSYKNDKHEFNDEGEIIDLNTNEGKINLKDLKMTIENK